MHRGYSAAAVAVAAQFLGGFTRAACDLFPFHVRLKQGIAQYAHIHHHRNEAHCGEAIPEKEDLLAFRVQGPYDKYLAPRLWSHHTHIELPVYLDFDETGHSEMHAVPSG